MALPKHEQPYLSEVDYLAFERVADSKHEYLDGQIYLMAGARLEHNVIVGNLITLLNNHLADSSCLVSPSDLRLKVASRKAYRYPDISVICGQAQLEDGDNLLNPTILIEVLSDSTMRIDRIEKLREYRSIVSLQEYLLVAQNEARVERFQRQDAANWLYTEVLGLDKSIDLAAITCTLALSTIYKKVQFPDDID